MKGSLLFYLTAVVLAPAEAFFVQSRSSPAQTLESGFGKSCMRLMQQKDSTEGTGEDETDVVMTTVSSEQQLQEFLSEDDRLCVVKFYSTWCKSCQKFGVKFRSLARESGDCIGNKGELERVGEMRFAEIEFSQTKALCKSLGIKRLPTIHIYKNEELISGFPCGPKKFPMLMEKLGRYKAMTESQLEFEAAMQEGEKIGELVAPQLVKEEAKVTADGEKDQWWRTVLP